MSRDKDHVLSPLSLYLRHRGGRRLSALGTDSDFAFLWKDLVTLGFPGAVPNWLVRQTLGEEDGPRKQCLQGILQCVGKSWSHLIHTHGKTQLREFRNLSRVPQLRMLCPALSTGHSSLQNPSGLAVLPRVLQPEPHGIQQRQSISLLNCPALCSQAPRWLSSISDKGGSSSQLRNWDIGSVQGAGGRGVSILKQGGGVSPS